MMEKKDYLLMGIVIISVVTIFLRFAPFILFSGKKKLHPFVEYLGKFLPYSIIAMLVIYCLKEVNILKYPYGLPEIISVIVVSLIQYYKSNAPLSIFIGTAIYMVLIQFVF